MFVIGVTGSNWKSTTASLLHHILNKTTAKTFLFSSVSIKIGEEVVKQKFKKNRKDVFFVNEVLASARDNGCRIAVLEISSWDLARRTFDEIHFDGAILTNLTHDHDDYDKSFLQEERYIKKLFTSVLRNKKNNKFAVFPYDDKIGRKWFQEIPFDKKISFSTHASSILKANKIDQYLDHTDFEFNYLGNQYTANSQLLGRFNVYNILAALWIICEMWIPIDEAVESIKSFEPLPNRLERISYRNKHYFLDIGHSPDALDKTLQFLKCTKKGRLIVVFWSPWNRDKLSRAQIGKVIQSYADIIVVTDQEPYSENRLGIINELIKQISYSEWERFFIIPDRLLAIKFALDIAETDDIVLFACKSRGRYQHTNLWKKVWNDKKIILEELNKRAE